MKEIPIWQKSCLTLEEAAAYSGVGINRIRKLTNDDRCDFVGQNGPLMEELYAKYRAVFDL